MTPTPTSMTLCNSSAAQNVDNDDEIVAFVTADQSEFVAVADLVMADSVGGESSGSVIIDDDGGHLLAADGHGITVAVAAAADRARNPLSISYVTAVFVLAFLCLVLGIVYGYIHYTKVNSRWSRRIFGGIGLGGGGHHGGGPGGAGDAHGPRSTHIFLIRNNGGGGGGNPKSIQSL